MNKEESEESRYFVRWETHARCMTTVLCSLMEHQSLVDVAICCGTNTIHAHKCVLAANSQYFREQLEKNQGTEQIIITGIDFTVIKSIMEYMYCGVTNILHKHLKFTIAAAKFFQLRGLQVLISEQQEVCYEADMIHIPPPVFLSKKPKYPNSCRPLNALPPSENFNVFKNPIGNETYMQRKIKRKFVRSEAEKACAKEAAASRLALEALQREIASTPQVSSFVIEESCTETTVENFIPHTDESYIENLDQIDNVPQLQVVNFHDLNSPFVNNQMINIDKTETGDNVVQFDISPNSTKDKLKHILGTDVPAHLEIMFRTSEGHFVNLTDDELQNLSDGTLQYQFVDENGQLGEVRRLEVQDQHSLPSYDVVPHDNAPVTVTDFTDKNIDCENQLLHIPTESNAEMFTNEQKSNPGSVVSQTSTLSLDKTSSNASTSSESKIDEADAFLDALKCEQNEKLCTNNMFECNDESQKGDYQSDSKPNILSDVDVDDVIDITDLVEGGGDGSYNAIKRMKLSSPVIINQNLPTSLLNTVSGSSEGGGDHQVVCNEQLFDVKINKPRRIMPNRKKKM